MVFLGPQLARVRPVRPSGTSGGLRTSGAPEDCKVSGDISSGSEHSLGDLVEVEFIGSAAKSHINKDKS